MRRLIPPLAAIAATIVACGGPDELSRDDGVRLALARDRIVAALGTEQRLSDSPAAAEKLVARVRKIVASGALEARQLDEFGLAALGELHLAVPSLVVVDRVDVPRELDRNALAAFLADAKTDPAAAMKPPVSAEVSGIVELVEAADAEADSEIPVVEQTVDAYLDGLAAKVAGVWPDLADRISAAQGDL